MKLRFNINACISCPTIRVDNAKCQNTVEELSRKLLGLNIPVISHDKIDVSCLQVGGKYPGLHLNEKGAGRMAIDFISYNRKD